MLVRHADKLWAFGNNTQVSQELLLTIRQMNIKYVMFEYDFKPCVFRSTKKHEMQTNSPCLCHNQPHGRYQSAFMVGAKVLFWCSDGQRDKFYRLFPQHIGKTVDFVQSSTFYPETILAIRSVRERKVAGQISVENRWAILGSNSWIKGTEDAIAYCKEHNMPYVILHNLPNEKFLEEIAKSNGLVFFPRDMDVGSRITTETKLLGGTPIVNENVLHVTEPWFNSSVEEIEQYLLDGSDRFWRVVKENV